MKIVIWYCNCDKREMEGAVKTDKVCIRCEKRGEVGVIYRVELDFEDKEYA